MQKLLLWLCTWRSIPLLDCATQVGGVNENLWLSNCPSLITERFWTTAILGSNYLLCIKKSMAYGHEKPFNCDALNESHVFKIRFPISLFPVVLTSATFYSMRMRFGLRTHRILSCPLSLPWSSNPDPSVSRSLKKFRTEPLLISTTILTVPSSSPAIHADLGFWFRLVRHWPLPLNHWWGFQLESSLQIWLCLPLVQTVNVWPFILPANIRHFSLRSTANGDSKTCTTEDSMILASATM